MNNFPYSKMSPFRIPISQVRYGKPFRLGLDDSCFIYYRGNLFDSSFDCYYVHNFELVKVYIPDDALVFPL